jgi:aldehyde dehydrogenase (NAD+)
MVLSILEHRDALGVKSGQNYIGGTWRDGTADAVCTQIHPATNEAVADLSVASAADVDDAVRAARTAFDEGPWPHLKALERKRILMKIVELVRRDMDELNRLQTLDNGMPAAFSNIYAVGADYVADVFEYHAGWVDKFHGQTLPTFTGEDALWMTLKEPVGVVGAIIPWNAPLNLFAAKIAPALAAGCTVVLKPSELASLAVVRLTALLEEAGLPTGVFNLVLGPGNPTGEALITHPGVDKVTFTGSRLVGSRIMAAGADDIRRVSLELGGKSANLVFADCPNLDLAAMSAFGMVAMGLSGQGCVCHTRALVERPIYDAFVEKAQLLLGMVKLGDPFDPATTSGPIISTRQLAKIEDFIASGTADGARLVTGGTRGDGELANGNYVNPTLVADVRNDMRIAQEEIFGPVLSVIPFDTEEEGIRLANDSSYGLGAGVQTANVARAIRVSRALRAGTIGVNTFAVNPHAPFGGYKTSGLGREGGLEGFEEYLETKTVVIQS